MVLGRRQEGRDALLGPLPRPRRHRPPRRPAGAGVAVPRAVGDQGVATDLGAVVAHPDQGEAGARALGAPEPPLARPPPPAQGGPPAQPVLGAAGGQAPQGRALPPPSLTGRSARARPRASGPASSFVPASRWRRTCARLATSPSSRSTSRST